MAVYGIRPSFGEALRDPHDDDTKRQAVELALEKARYEARRAQRQFDAVDPENRLVASELEQRWNQALAQAVEVARLATLRAQPEPLNERQKERLLKLGADLRQLWQHPAAAVELKKRILRTVLEDIVVTTSDAPPQHLLHLHWKGGVHTELRVRRNGTGQHSRVADENAVELIAELSKICDDKAIAVVLNRLGYRTGQANPGACIMSITCDTVGDSPTTAMMAPGAVRGRCTRARGQQHGHKNLIADGVLPATQVVTCAPWVIERVDLQRPSVQARIQAVHDGRKPPRPIRGQDELPLK